MPGSIRPVQCVSQGARASLLRPLFRQQPRQLDGGVFLGHLQPQAALLARIVHGIDAHAGLLRQRLDQFLAHLLAGDERGRHRHTDVVLGNEGFQHLDFHGLHGPLGRRIFDTSEILHRGRVLDMRREVRAVAQMPATANHRQVHTGLAALHLHGQDVHVLVRSRVH